MRLHLPILAWLAVAAAAPASADVAVRYAAVPTGGPGLVIEADESGRIRAEAGTGQVLIVRDGRTFVVPPGQGAERPVIGLEDYMAVQAERLAEFRRSGAIRDAPPTRYELHERGPRSVGQWQGILYSIDPVAGAAAELSSEIVISSDPALAPAARAVAQVFGIIAQILEASAGPGSPDYARLSRALWARGLTLSLQGIYRLESVGADPVPADRFDLPGRVLSRDEARALLAR